MKLKKILYRVRGEPHPVYGIVIYYIRYVVYEENIDYVLVCLFDFFVFFCLFVYLFIYIHMYIHMHVCTYRQMLARS